MSIYFNIRQKNFLRADRQVEGHTKTIVRNLIKIDNFQKSPKFLDLSGLSCLSDKVPDKFIFTIKYHICLVLKIFIFYDFPKKNPIFFKLFIKHILKRLFLNDKIIDKINIKHVTVSNFQIT